MPEEHYTAEGRRKLRRGAIAEALLRQAERLAFEIEMNPTARRGQIEATARLIRLSRKLDEAEKPRQVKRRAKREGSTGPGPM